ncbi:rho GTPase-activating protein 32-like [Brevipalpus obovatus]|uniref:rho GTPase-activating protein 32-like n=1 Tax=Brevipalpus obovatus TaxID=246614 RepID=UPI003D9E09EE
MILTERQFDGQDDDCMVDINTPAIAAAVVIRSYTAEETDELSFEIGDIISIIEIPSSEETSWWLGKNNSFQVGFFPSDCVQIISDPSSLVVFPNFYSSINSLNSPKDSPNRKSQQTQTQELEQPVLRDSGKILTFFRSIIPNRPSSRSTGKYGDRSSHRVAERTFGCDLSSHLHSTCRVIPVVLKCCAEFIEKHGVVDGIYRLSGVKSNIQKLRHSFDLARIPDLEEDAFLQDIHCVASLLKLYFRELPNPLLTYELYEKFINAIQPNSMGIGQPSSSNISESMKISNLRDVIQQLPPTHYRTLEYLLRHLSRVAAHGSRTGMTSKNLAIVWSPNLLRCQNLENPGCFGALHYVGVQAVLTEYLIKYVDILFSKDPRSRGRSGSLRPKSLPVSCSKLLTLEEARGRSGCLIEEPHSPEPTNQDSENSGSVNTRYHTIIDSIRGAKLGNGHGTTRH